MLTFYAEVFHDCTSDCQQEITAWEITAEQVSQLNHNANPSGFCVQTQAQRCD